MKGILIIIFALCMIAFAKCCCEADPSPAEGQQNTAQNAPGFHATDTTSAPVSGEDAVQ
ncbi:MAG: hypothetical protein ACOYNS_08685 [Bacteroidota bacterium]